MRPTVVAGHGATAPARWRMAGRQTGRWCGRPTACMRRTTTSASRAPSCARYSAMPNATRWSTRSPAACSAACAAQCWNARSRTGKASTRRSASASRTRCAPAPRANLRPAWARAEWGHSSGHDALWWTLAGVPAARSLGVAALERPHRTRIHPLHAFLLAATVPLFLGALLSDAAYTRTQEIQWTNFASWLIAGGLVFAGAALLWAAVDYFRADRGLRRHLYPLVLLAAWVLG